MRALILAVFFLAPTLGAAAPCALVNTLTRLYWDMDAAAARPDRLTEQDVRRLMLAAQRFDSRSLVNGLQSTEIAAYAAPVVAPLHRLLAEGSTRVGDRTIVAGLEGSGARHALNRALALMSRLDCADQIGGATEDGYLTALMRRINGAATANGGVFAVVGPIGGSGIALFFAGLIIFVLFRRFDAGEKRKQRYVCSIPATVAPGSAADPAAWHGVHVLDLSREGVKLTALGKQTPRVGDRFSLRIDSLEVEGTVRWANHTAFGALFRVPLTAEERDTLLGHSRTEVQVMTRRRRDRKNAAEKKNGTPKDAAVR